MNYTSSCSYKFIPVFTFQPLTHQHPLLTLIFFPGVLVHLTFVWVLIAINFLKSPLESIWCDICLICHSSLTWLCSKFLCIPKNGIFCIFIMLESYFLVYLWLISFSFCLNPIILFLSSLGHCEWCCITCLQGWRCGCVFSTICWFLKCSRNGTSLWHNLSHFVTVKQSCS